MGQTIIDAAGVSLTRGKGIFVPMVAGVAFANMTLKGAAVSDLNGAGIREVVPASVGQQRTWSSPAIRTAY